MRLDLLFYRLAYRFGKPRWDTAEPRPELAALVHDRPPARALDLGCGTGASVLYLASRGWDAVGCYHAIQAGRREQQLGSRFVAYHLVRTTTQGGSADVADRVCHVGWGRQPAARAGDRQGA